MRYRQLLVFVTVYEEKSVSRAAEKLCITQSQASRALTEIQEEYQVILSNRTRHGLAFTPAAREFYHHAKSIVSRWQEMEKSLKRQDMAEDIRLGSSISIGTCMLPALVKEYTKRYPNRNVYVTVNSADIIEHMVARDQLDFALTDGALSG